MPADGSPTSLFCLSGVVVHELAWRKVLEALIQFRHYLKSRYHVYLDAEIHAGEMIGRIKELDPSLARLKKYERLAIIRQYADMLAGLPEINIINVVIDKRGKVPSKEDVFKWAWVALFQRFENTIQRGNFPGPKNATDRGIIFPDNTDGGKLTKFLNEMRHKNLLKVRVGADAHALIDEPISTIIENPVLRDSKESYFLQSADCAAFLLKQSIEPSAYMKRNGGQAYFRRMEPVLCKRASNSDPLGVVRL